MLDRVVIECPEWTVKWYILGVGSSFCCLQLGDLEYVSLTSVSFVKKQKTSVLSRTTQLARARARIHTLVLEPWSLSWDPCALWPFWEAGNHGPFGSTASGLHTQADLWTLPLAHLFISENPGGLVFSRGCAFFTKRMVHLAHAI